MFPTKTAVALAKASNLDDVFDNTVQPFRWEQSLGTFQRLSLVTDFDTCMKALMPAVQTKLNHQHKQVLHMIYDMAKADVMGLAVEALVDVASGKYVTKDKIAAATVLNELYGEKQLIEDVKITDKLMINLVKD